jgi:demethylmenaquinone methyltransferase/2-methoxy-6-polyprenyl-1,4-benzoquinol methylase
MAGHSQATPSRGTERENQVRRIFSEIAPRYDLLNHLLSLNIDRRWRRKAVSRLGWERYPRGRFLDACAGTFDLSLELTGRNGFGGYVAAADFARPMLVEGGSKIRRAPVHPVCGDTLRLPFPDHAFHGAMVAFGVRNLSDLEAGLNELRRVLRPRARLVILDFALPGSPLLRRLYTFYFNRVLPAVGRLVSGHPWAYTYLPESVKEFPEPPVMAALMRSAGFDSAEWTSLTGGIAVIHVGERSG